VPQGVEATRRVTEDGQEKYLFLLNHRSDPAKVRLPGTHTDLLTGKNAGPELVLPAQGVAVLRETS
jgi:beta-galactosidase